MLAAELSQLSTPSAARLLTLSESCCRWQFRCSRSYAYSVNDDRAARGCHQPRRADRRRVVRHPALRGRHRRGNGGDRHVLVGVGARGVVSHAVGVRRAAAVDGDPVVVARLPSARTAVPACCRCRSRRPARWVRCRRESPHPVLLGPYSLNVIVPPAGAPPVPVRLMTGLAGWVAVPPRAAESVTAVPRYTSAPAVVDSVGVTGLTVKHSELTRVARRPGCRWPSHRRRPLASSTVPPR